jgi:predicted DNA-binding transcriptional regulator AlpA
MANTVAPFWISADPQSPRRGLVRKPDPAQDCEQRGGAQNPWRVTPPPVKRPIRGPTPDAVICCTRLSPLERVATRRAGLLCFARSASAPPARLGARLLSKREVLAIVGVSYPTLWSWMRQGKFPRSRVVGGKSMWLSTDIEAWLATLPVRKLKGDAPEALDNENPASVG